MYRLSRGYVLAVISLTLAAQARGLAQAPASNLPVPALPGATGSSAPASPGATLLAPSVLGDPLTCAPACTPATAPSAPRPFTPFMLGDFTTPLASLFLDLKIAEGQSPRPIDRVYYNFNGFANVNKDAFNSPFQSVHNVNLYRHVLGFEKTFFDGQVSLGVRLPFYTVTAEAKDFALQPTLQGPVVGPGGPAIDGSFFGNASVIAKGILWEDKQTGDLISAGATICVPTASSHLIDPGPSTLAYLQPFGGFIVNRGNLFVQGFTSVTVPVASAESILLFVDVGTGYWIYRDESRAGFLTGIAPTFEVHVAAPLRQVNPTINIFGFVDPIQLHDVVDLTLGTTFELSGRATLGVGVVVPVTGPKPFDIEGLVQLNWRF